MLRMLSHQAFSDRNQSQVYAHQALSQHYPRRPFAHSSFTSATLLRAKDTSDGAYLHRSTHSSSSLPLYAALHESGADRRASGARLRGSVGALTDGVDLVESIETLLHCGAAG